MSSNNKKFSIVISHFCADEMFTDRVKSLLAQSYNPDKYEIIIVDDGFTLSVDTLTCLSAMGKVKIVQKSHTGVCATRNKGIEVTNGRYIIFLDQDCEADSNLITEYFDYFTAHPEIAAVGGTVLSATPKNYVARYCTYRGHLKQPIITKGRISSVITVNACYKREVLLDVGMFAEELDELHLVGFGHWLA